MIKNVIFDLDNTIIKDSESDALYYKEALRKYGDNEDDYMKLYNVIDEYDKTFSEDNYFYNANDLLDFMNNYLGKNYPIELINEVSKIIGEHWIKPVNLDEDTVKYLSNKYNLYVYTNYFESAQVKRIENIGYLKYFKKVFAADKFGCKPFKKSFSMVLDYIKSTPEECIMIGDSKKTDILAANNIGMKSILYDYDGKRDNDGISLKDYIVIHDLKELMNIL